MTDFHIVDSLTRNSISYELKKMKNDQKNPDYRSLLSAGDDSVARTYHNCFEMLDECDSGRSDEMPPCFERLNNMTTKLTPNKKIENYCTAFAKELTFAFRSNVARCIAYGYEIAKSLSSSFSRRAGRCTWTTTRNGDLASN
ncbi:hypothetical protein GJ496_002751 [Pomphorhynchus laevis]|nr:hypothetical protein GJ496_002751 [Pomphorhynchus laevis]